MADKQRSSVLVTSCIGLNLVSSITIVLLNKWIYTYYGFPNISMTCIHFIFTTIGLILCSQANVFQPKSLPIIKMLPLSLTFCGFVVFTNLSLQTNTVGTYQMAKTMTTPCIIFIQSFYYNRRFSTNVKLTLVPITLGVLLNSFYDLKFSLSGSVYATVGFLVTSLYQVWVGEKQGEFQVNSMQLLYYQAPISATLLMLVVPFFEPVFGDRGVLSVWSFEAVLMVGASSVVAFLVNLSIYWIIGNTSPLTYNMIGHCKFCLTLVGSLLLFGDKLQLLQIAGVSLTFLGTVLYSCAIEEQTTVKPKNIFKRR